MNQKKTLIIFIVFAILVSFTAYLMRSREYVDYTDEIQSAGIEYMKQKYGACGATLETKISTFNVKQYGLGRASIAVDCSSGPEGKLICPLDLHKDKDGRWTVIDKEYLCAVS